jgi:DNA replication protein DnaC
MITKICVVQICIYTNKGIFEVIEQTKTTLAQLKCYGMLAGIDTRLAEATSAGWSHTEFISALTTDERLHRENDRIKRRIRVANFRQDASMERLDLTSKRNLTKTQVQDLFQLGFINAPRNVIILGPTGVGKTYLATALGNQACRKGYSSFFIGMNMLIEKLAISRAEGGFLKLRDKLTKVDLLILDDLGIKRLPPSAVQDLYDIMEERHQSKSTVITTQLPVENWKEVIEDPVALEAIIDRIIHGSISINLKGESYRKTRANSLPT